MSWHGLELYKNFSHKAYPCFSFAGCLENKLFSVCRTNTKWPVRAACGYQGQELWGLTAQQSHTHPLLQPLLRPPPHFWRNLESKRLTRCYVQFEERAIFPRSGAWAATFPHPALRWGLSWVPVPGAAHLPWWRRRCGSAVALPSPLRSSRSGSSCCHTPPRWKSSLGRGSHPRGTGRDGGDCSSQSPRGKQRKAEKHSPDPSLWLRAVWKHPDCSSAAGQHALNF